MRAARSTFRLGRVLVAALAALLPLVWAPAAAAAPSSGGAARIEKTSGGAVHSGGSATQFAVALPGRAACPGDTMHGQYVINSYVLPVTKDLASVRFPDGYPSSGDDLVSVQGVPYIAQNTIPYTGVIGPLPAFSWAVYAHHPEVLPPGLYNVGIVCGDRNSRPTRYWNAQIRFSVSSTDSGGFTWTVIAQKGTGSGGISTGMAILIAVGAVVVLGLGTLTFSRRRLSRRRAPVPSR